MNQCNDPHVRQRLGFALLGDDAELGRRATAVTFPEAGICTGAAAATLTGLVNDCESLGDDLRALSDGLDRVVSLAGAADDTAAFALDLLAAAAV
jgi:hypothetical protein